MMLRVFLCAIMALAGCASNFNDNRPPDASVSVDLPYLSAPGELDPIQPEQVNNLCRVQMDPMTPAVAVEGSNFATVIFRVDSTDNQSGPCHQTTDLVVCYHTAGVAVNAPQEQGGDFNLSGKATIVVGTNKVEVHLQPFADQVDEDPESVEVILDPCPGYRLPEPAPSASSTTIYDRDPSS